jgi:zeaxanthin glucosyltransferase
MKIGFYTPPVPGHMNPMTALARRMKSRGHEVCVISFTDAKHFAHAAQLPFLPICEKQYPPGKLGAVLQENSQLHGLASMKFVFDVFLAQSLKYVVPELSELLLRENIDALVLDDAQLGLSLVPMHLGMPYATVANALYMDFSGNTPFFFFDWPNDSSSEGLTRNREALKKVDYVFESCRVEARACAERLGLKIDWADPFALKSKIAWIAQLPEAFDFKNIPWPPQFHYTGPFNDGQGRMDANFPWEKLTGEPMTYASMGTVQNGVESVFNIITEAVGQQRGTQLVLSIGPFIKPESLKAVPANAIVLPHIPQVEVLKRASLCITHGGLNTTLESLTQGVPMVAIPVTNDQPGVAARIAYTKTGIFIPVEELSIERLSTAIDEVQSNPKYRQNARHMKRVIAKTNGLDKAATLLEEAFRSPSQRDIQ